MVSEAEPLAPPAVPLLASLPPLELVEPPGRVVVEDLTHPVDRSIRRPEHVHLERVRVAGKFLWAGDQKFYVRGVTYGTFAPGEDESGYPDDFVVERDFANMAAGGINAVRTYTVPPRRVLDAAQRHGLRVLVGLPWEQHVTFLDDPQRVRSIEARVRESVRACAGHPAVLAYAIGNEIPASIVRWHGARRIERFLKRLYRAAKETDPEALITYVNFPSTEYLQLPFADFVCFNVYLESQEQLQSYLSRLQTLAGDRPLLLGEIGLDSRRNGEDGQAQALDWQVRCAFAAGCAGAFVFAWTDEWHRGGYEIDDWDFGLTGRDRRPKRSLAAVQRAFSSMPYPSYVPWPRVSVVVCSYNGARTIRDCLEGLERLEYPDYEVIVVDDGSTDDTAAITCDYDVRLISTQNRGLSSARNTGLQAATGKIVAYTDDDARPDPHWLTYLVATLLRSDFAGAGGPNIAPAGDGPLADCVANAPGGPVHVLLTDEEAEHIPGCNMAFWKRRLEAIGGFDPQFRTAGDDVDLCWRLQERGWKLGFSPAAMVWHHRRNSLRAYWKQQLGYGKAEALLEAKWPAKYNAAGHTTWAGRLYGKGLTKALAVLPWSSGRIYQGVWGTGLFQSLYEPRPGLLAALPLMPEWYLLLALLGVLSLLGSLWPSLLAVLPVLILAAGAPVVQALLSAAHASFTSAPRGRLGWCRLFALTALLHLLQPLARLRGRLRHGLSPWRRRGAAGLAMPLPARVAVWSEQWQAPEDWLGAVERILAEHGLVIRRGGDFDSWDLEVRGGLLGTTRTRMAVEEHGAGRQFVRFHVWPRGSWIRLASVLVMGGLAVAATLDGSWIAGCVLSLLAAALAARAIFECAASTAAMRSALRALGVEVRA